MSTLAPVNATDRTHSAAPGQEDLDGKRGPQSHHRFYSDAHAYDVAFSYRDVAAELDFLVGQATRWLGHPPTTAAELACGPGAHATALAARGLLVTGLDLSAPMIERLISNARRNGVGDGVVGVVGDMADFTLSTPVELAFNLLTSISYLLTTEQLHGHFASVARSLVPGGVYVVENNHPNDFWSRSHFEPSRWTEREGDETNGLEVSTSWMDTPPVIDPITQTYSVRARTTIRAWVDGVVDHRTLEDQATLRMLFPQELKAFGEAHGLQFKGFYGALDADLAIDAADAWRTVAVFTKG